MLIGYAYEEQWYSFIGKQHFNYNHKSTSICCSFLWQQAIPFDSVQLFLSDYLKKIFETLPSASNDWRTCLQWIIDLQRGQSVKALTLSVQARSALSSISHLYSLFILLLPCGLYSSRVPLWHWKLKICIHCFMSSLCHGNLKLCTLFQK